MKYFTTALVASMLSMATGFAPVSQSLGVPRTSETRRFDLDPDTIHHLIQHGADAARVVLLDCDQQDCSMIDGTKMSDGWHFENRMGGGVDTNGPGHHTEFLMMELEDTE